MPFPLLRPLALVVGALTLAFALQEEETGEPVALEPGEWSQLEIDLSALSESSVTCTLEVPIDAVALQVELVSRRADLDLVVRLGDEDDPELLQVSATELGRELVVLDRFSEPKLAPGTFVVEVLYGWDELPLWRGQRVTRVPFELRAVLTSVREDAELAAGVPIAGTIDDDCGRFRSYRIAVPDDAPALRVDVLAADGDIDLFLRRERRTRGFGEFDRISESLYGCETLVHARDGERGLRSGIWWLDVVERWSVGTGPTRFRLQLGFDAAPAPELLAIAPFPARVDSTPLERALASVVELFVPEGSGSGVLVDERGLVLTNAHLVSDLGGKPLDEAVVAITTDPRVPSAERFLARVVQFDAERDLALVRIDRGLLGQPLPDGYRFPAIERGDPETISIGDPLWLVGYPGTGGSRTRVSITATRGIAAGFEASAWGTLVKTDAALHGGHSGGAVLDVEGRFVAVPSFVIQEEFNGLGYAIPLSAVPAAWWSAEAAR